MTIDKDRLYAALDENATTGSSVRIFVGLSSAADIWKLHEALGAQPLVSGWTITRQEGGFRDDGYWTTEPGIIVEFINLNGGIEADDTFVETVARWAHQNGQKELLIIHAQGLYTTTLNLKGLLEEAPALV